jgi:hypothetical protein
MDDQYLRDLEARAEFERQQFLLYDGRRLSAEVQANTVIAASLAVAAVLVGDYGRPDHPRVVWLLVGLLGLGWGFVVANIARFVSYNTPRWRGGAKFRVLPSDVVWETLDAARKGDPGDSVAIRQLTLEHWRARAESAYELGKLKDCRLRWSVGGFLGPAVYFAVRLAT